MAYIGKAPNTAIVNQATSQSFSGNGSTTAFTLTRSVNVGEDLEVFVNNVQQEPGSGKSYTASGTTLTFDEAPPSGTNNVYVIYRGEATINPRLEHDANAALSATTGTFSGAVSGTTGTFTQLNTDNIRIDGNTISSTDTNGNITLDPNGTGSVAITGGFTATDGCTITTADNNAQLTLKSTDADGNSGPVLDLHRDSSSPADNDELGLLNFKGENDASEVTAYTSLNGYIKDATDGSEDGRAILRVLKDGENINLIDMKSDEVVFNEDSKDIDFRCESDNKTHAFFIRGNDGFTGVGTSGPNAPLEVSGTSANDNLGAFAVYNNSTANNAAVAAFATGSSNTSTSNVLLRFGSNFYAAGQGMITAAGGGAAAFAAFSDRTLKENIADLPSQLANIMALRPVEFDYIESEGGGHQIGFIAQEVEEIYPDLVGENDDGIKMLAGFDKTSARLVKALQEAVAKIEALETKVAALEGN